MRPLLLLLALASAVFADGNRLAYLEAPSPDPFYPDSNFAKLITPQWVGEEGVEAVAILSIDDMRDTAKYEAYLRPILDRLKVIDGRAPVSIFTCTTDPADAQLQSWLKEGLSIEVHTIKHPCPLLGAGGTIDEARATVHNCIDLLAGIPNMQPVAFRMPCCDSQNSLSPRFFSEIFSKATPVGNSLKADSSVFTLLNTPDNRLEKYVPKLRGYAGYIEDYPYPYVIGGNCWEFPCIVPSDWEAQDRHGPNNPETVADLKFALDRVVEMQGVFTLCFHPHGWIENTQIVELIDHAQKAHGKKIKFMTIAEAVARLEKNLMGGLPLREMVSYQREGEERFREVINGRVLDLDADGYMDSFAFPNSKRKTYETQTRLWNPEGNAWGDVIRGESAQEYRFGVLRDDGGATLIYEDDQDYVLHFEEGAWKLPSFSSLAIRDKTSRLLDIDGDGVCELLSPLSRTVYKFDPGNPNPDAAPTERRPRRSREPAARRPKHVLESWAPSTIEIPDRVEFGVGSRFADLDGDGDLDLVVSTKDFQGLYLFDEAAGTFRPIYAGSRSSFKAEQQMPLFVREDGSNNGAWISRGRIFWQNEETGQQQSQVLRMSFAELMELAGNTFDHPMLRSMPMSPEDSLAAMEVEPGLRVQLVAAEPLVQDPIDIAWSSRSSFYVVEMGGYPSTERDSRVRHLSDQDGDGVMDSSTIMAKGLNFPTAVTPWKRGAIVVAPPDILYISHNKRPEVLYTGFREGNQQHRANGLRWGLDNWLYLANGDSGGIVRSIKSGARVELGGRDLRIRPETGEIELCTGRTQFGRTRNDWGDWFGCSNSQPLWHFVLPDRYLARNPYAASPSPIKHLFGVGGRPNVFPISETLERFNDFDNANKITSACGANIYRDNLLGDGFSGDAFICEPVHNLVVRMELEDAGASFVAQRAGPEGGEFLRSKDNWFRPVNTRTGPDGALYVVDMYRHVIEHPEWIPDEWQAKLELRAGKSRGRIYRVLPADGAPRTNHELSTKRGVSVHFEHPNGIVRDLRHRKEIEFAGNDKELRELLDSSDRPEARLHALCILDGTGTVSPADVHTGLADPHPGVRRNAIRIAERFAGDAEILAELSKLVADPDAKVRQQLAFSLGEWPDEKAGVLLARLSRAEPGNRYLQAAIISSAYPHAKRLLAAETALDRDKLERTAKSPPVAKSRPKLEVERKRVPVWWKPSDRLKFEDTDPASADRGRGELVFKTHCATCHRFRGLGVEVGPDLGALKDRSTDALLDAVLFPGKAMEEKYALHIAKSGEEVVGSGILVEETATSFTLLTAGGVRQTLLGEDLDSMQNTLSSMMPATFSKLLTPQEMADLISYLQQ